MKNGKNSILGIDAKATDFFTAQFNVALKMCLKKKN